MAVGARAVTGVLLVAMAAGVGLPTAGAGAAGGPFQQAGTSNWVQPGSAPLDGTGVYVYAHAPTPGPGQGSPVNYEYDLDFSLEHGGGGFVAFGYRRGAKVAGFNFVGTPDEVATVAYDWTFDHFYFLLAYRLTETSWGGWIYDYAAATWTFIGARTAAAGTGGIAPTSGTVVEYGNGVPVPPGADTATCAAYPRVDAYVYPPIGWRGLTTTVATLGSSIAPVGDCPAVTTTEFGWQHYQLGSLPVAA